MIDWHKEFHGRRLAAARRHDATASQSAFRLRHPRFPSRSAIRRAKQRASTKQNTTGRATHDFVEQMYCFPVKQLTIPLPFPDAKIVHDSNNLSGFKKPKKGNLFHETLRDTEFEFKTE